MLGKVNLRKVQLSKCLWTPYIQPFVGKFLETSTIEAFKTK